MKFDCGPSYAEKREAKMEWHRKFAWLPKRVGPRDCRWLEWIERKGRPFYTFASGECWSWEYREIKP